MGLFAWEVLDQLGWVESSPTAHFLLNLSLSKIILGW